VALGAGGLAGVKARLAMVTTPLTTTRWGSHRAGTAIALVEAPGRAGTSGG
jgi:hypothetical protein